MCEAKGRSVQGDFLLSTNLQMGGINPSIPQREGLEYYHYK